MITNPKHIHLKADSDNVTITTDDRGNSNTYALRKLRLDLIDQVSTGKAGGDRQTIHNNIMNGAEQGTSNTYALRKLRLDLIDQVTTNPVGRPELNSYNITHLPSDNRGTSSSSVTRASSP